MNRRSCFQLYCAFICVLCVGTLILFTGRTLLYTYDYFNPESGLNPAYRLDQETEPLIAKLPEGFNIEYTDEEISKIKKRIYEAHLADYKYEVSAVAKQNGIYAFLIAFIFIGHFLLLRNDSKQKT